MLALLPALSALALAGATLAAPAFPVAYIPTLSLGPWEFTIADLSCAAANCPIAQYRVRPSALQYSNVP